MKKLNGKEIINYLADRQCGNVSVRYINTITPVYNNKQDKDNGLEIPEDNFLMLDYNVEEFYLYGAYPSSLDESDVAIGVSEDSIKGWLEDNNSLWIIGAEDTYPEDKKSYSHKDGRYYCYCLHHLPTGNIFISNLCFTKYEITQCFNLNVEDRESRLLELTYFSEELDLPYLIVTRKILQDCIVSYSYEGVL